MLAKALTEAENVIKEVERDIIMDPGSRLGNVKFETVTETGWCSEALCDPNGEPTELENRLNAGPPVEVSADEVTLIINSFRKMLDEEWDDHPDEVRPEVEQVLADLEIVADMDFQIALRSTE